MSVYSQLHGIEFDLNDVDEPDRIYFEACRSGRLQLQRCTGCALLRFPPAWRCPYCGGDGHRWEEVPPTGTIYSFTRVHGRLSRNEAGPHMIGVVSLDAQMQPAAAALRIPAMLVSTDFRPLSGEAIGIGAPVRMLFAALDDDMAAPVWTPIEDGPGGGTTWKRGKGGPD